jgi:hypothetical protein
MMFRLQIVSWRCEHGPRLRSMDPRPRTQFGSTDRDGARWTHVSARLASLVQVADVMLRDGGTPRTMAMHVSEFPTQRGPVEGGRAVTEHQESL